MELFWVSQRPSNFFRSFRLFQQVRIRCAKIWTKTWKLTRSLIFQGKFPKTYVFWLLSINAHFEFCIFRNLKEYTADIILRSAFSRHENRKYIQELIIGISDNFKLMSNWLFHLTWIVPSVGGLLGLFSFVLLLFSNKTVGRFLKQMLTDVRNRKKEKVSVCEQIRIHTIFRN